VRTGSQRVGGVAPRRDHDVRPVGALRRWARDDLDAGLLETRGHRREVRVRAAPEDERAPDVVRQDESEVSAADGHRRPNLVLRRGGP
jgi:hypothetical protein